MAGTITVTQELLSIGPFAAKKVQKTKVAFVGDSSSGAVPNGTVNLSGRLTRVVYVPGTTNPTNSTALAIQHPTSNLDAAKGSIVITAGATAQEWYPIVATGIAIQPLCENGTYTLVMSANSVASANGTFEIYTE